MRCSQNVAVSRCSAVHPARSYSSWSWSAGTLRDGLCATRATSQSGHRGYPDRYSDPHAEHHMPRSSQTELIREQRHRNAGVGAEAGGAGDRGGAEPLADVVEGGVEGLARAAVEGEHELGDAVVRFATAMPTSVIPCCSVSGRAVWRSDKTAARIVSVCAVARSSVWERVMRVKSPKRIRSTTVRPTRSAARMRRVTRSTSSAAIASSSARRAWPPTECMLGSHRAAAPADLHGPRVVVLRKGVQVPARSLAERARRATASLDTCDFADGVDATCRAASPRCSARRPTAARWGGGGGTPAHGPAARRASRRAWQPRSRPSPGTSCARRRP